MNSVISKPTPVSRWNPEHELDAMQFQALLDNEIAGIVVDNFLEPLDCLRLVSTLRDFGLKTYEYDFDDTGVPPAAHLFEPHYLYELKSPGEYWPKVEESYALYDQLVEQAGIDPVRKLMATLGDKTGRSVTIAQQDGHLYFFALVRELNNSVLLHTDYAPALPPHWSISEIKSELAWNIYLTDPGEGGECRVYNCPWQPEYDHHLIGETYAYDPMLVEGAPLVPLKPMVGRLIIFNSRNLHDVTAASQSRVAIGGHFGAHSNGNVICWA